MVSLEEAKLYLAIDHDDDDQILQSMIDSSEQIVADVMRVDNIEKVQQNIRVAILYAVAYMYEHREEADLRSLTLNLRAYLFGVREPGF